MSVAVDAGGPAAAKPYHDQATASFPTLVDQHNQLGGYLGARVVPNGLFVDEAGRIVWMKIGGFSVANPGDIATIEAWLADGSVPSAELTAGDSLKGELITTYLRLADVLLHQGRRDRAVTEMEHALRLDPDNFIVRKQIWRLRFPDRFHPKIDTAWQKTQLAAERAAEAACGPDGCPIPAAGQQV